MEEMTKRSVKGCENCGGLRFVVFESVTDFCTLDIATGVLTQNDGLNYASDITDVRCENCNEEYDIENIEVKLKPIGE